MSTLLELHQTYLTLTVGKNILHGGKKRKKKILYSPPEGDNFFLFPFKTSILINTDLKSTIQGLLGMINTQRKRINLQSNLFTFVF